MAAVGYSALAPVATAFACQDRCRQSGQENPWADTQCSRHRDRLLDEHRHTNRPGRAYWHQRCAWSCLRSFLKCGMSCLVRLCWHRCAPISSAFLSGTAPVCGRAGCQKVVWATLQAKASKGRAEGAACPWQRRCISRQGEFGDAGGMNWLDDALQFRTGASRQAVRRRRWCCARRQWLRSG